MICASRTSFEHFLLGVCTLALASCVYKGDHQNDQNVDVNSGPICPTDQPHLTLVLRPLTYDGDNAVFRLDRNLRPCRGLSLSGSDYGSVSAVGGTSSGMDLIGFDNGVVLLVDGSQVVWGVEHENSLAAYSVMSLWYQGVEIVAILWGDTYGSYGDSVDFIGLRNPEPIQHFEVGSDVIHLARPLNGETNKISGLIKWDGVQQYTINPGAQTFGETGEIQVAAPYDQLNWLEVTSTQALIASEHGIMHWSFSSSPAFLGPVPCQWPNMIEDSVEYTAVAHDPSSEQYFLSLFKGTLVGDESQGSYMLRSNTVGECEILYSATSDLEFVGMAWSGL